MMKVEIKLGYLIIIALILIGAIWTSYSIIRGKYHSQIDRLSTELYQAEKRISEYKIMVGGYEEYVSESKAVIVKQNSDIFKLKQEKERLRELDIRRVHTIGNLRTSIRILRDSIPPSDTIIIVEDCDKEGSFIKLPLAYRFTDQWVDLQTGINTQGLGNFDVEIKPFTTNIVIGERGVFKKESVSIVSTQSPYIGTDAINFAVVEDRRKNPLYYYGIGAGSAVAVVVLLNLLVN